MKRTPMKSRNPKRRSREFARSYGSAARVLWVQSLECVGCGASPSQNAHTITGGLSRKADAETIAPLCNDCHTKYDQHLEPFDVPECRNLVIAAAVRVAARWRRMEGVA